MASPARAVPSAKKAWNMGKLYAAVKDLPEVMPLFALVGGAVGGAFYQLHRVYFHPTYETVPSKAARKDVELQISKGQDMAGRDMPSVWRHVADFNVDEQGGPNIHVWPLPSNRAYPGEYQIHTSATQAARNGVPAEGPSPVEH